VEERNVCDQHANGDHRGRAFCQRPLRHNDYRNVKLDPSITDSTNVSFTSNSTVTRADANHHGDYTPLDPSIASLTMHGVVKEPLMKSDPPSILSNPRLQVPYPIRSTQQRMDEFPMYHTRNQHFALF
jgi:hypothetical protein